MGGAAVYGGRLRSSRGRVLGVGRGRSSRGRVEGGVAGGERGVCGVGRGRARIEGRVTLRGLRRRRWTPSAGAEPHGA